MKRGLPRPGASGAACARFAFFFFFLLLAMRRIVGFGVRRRHPFGVIAESSQNRTLSGVE
jgi:hypothetical protein